MSDDEKREDIQLWGDARDEALGACKDIIAGWGLTMPQVEPFVLDFGLGRFDQVGEVEFWVANEKDEGYCGKFLFVFDGQTCPYHHHDMKHETFFVLKGAVKMVVDGREVVKREGDLLPMPPGTDHSFTGQGPALLLEVSKPCLVGDNFFQDKSVGRDGVI